jgi:hypothetical protein
MKLQARVSGKAASEETARNSSCFVMGCLIKNRPAKTIRPRLAPGRRTPPARQITPHERSAKAT